MLSVLTGSDQRNAAVQLTQYSEIRIFKQVESVEGRGILHTPEHNLNIGENLQLMHARAMIGCREEYKQTSVFGLAYDLTASGPMSTASPLKDREPCIGHSSFHVKGSYFVVERRTQTPFGKALVVVLRDQHK